MAIELKVPAVGESITEVLLVRWFKKEGEAVAKDDPLVEIETDKATFELPAPAAGTLTRIVKGDGQPAEVGEVIGQIEEAGAPAAGPASAPAAEPTGERKPAEQAAETPEPAQAEPARPEAARSEPARNEEPRIMPAARREMAQRGIRPEEVQPTGPGDRILKEDVLREIGAAPAEGRQGETPPAKDKRTESAPPAAETRSPLAPAPLTPDGEAPATSPQPAGPAGEAVELDRGRLEEVVAMSPMRKRIAERLVQAQQTAALLTTFNEIDMSAVMDLRNKYRDTFQQKYNIKLGLMSFFVKACVEALKEFPQLNAEIRGNDIVYRNYYDIGIAVSSGKGLVVPVIRGAERMSFAQIEMAVADFGNRARDNRITLEELKGGTFTITNGGIFGSLLSTPIVNPPQSGILGMHAIQDRPVARGGQVVIRAMMYVALTYDHRLVDGREAVTFLRRIKEVIEDPSRMLIEV